MTVRERTEPLWANFQTFSKLLKTEDMDDQGKVRPYPDFDEFPFVKKLHNFFHNPTSSRRRGLCLKSRRMFVSTAYCAHELWRAMGAHKSRGDVYASCKLSQTEKHSISLMRRTMGMYDKLPEEVRVARPVLKRTETLTLFADGGELHALHAGGEGPRTDGYKDSLADEMAFQERALANWRALLPCSQNVYGVSTPNGPGNLFYDLWHGEMEGTDGMVRLKLHYSDHPYRMPGTEIGDAWVASMKTGMPLVDWLREYEMRFDIFAEPGILSADWDRACIDNEQVWDEQSVIDLAWDPGYDRSACIAAYQNQYSQWIVLHVFLGKEQSTDDFAYYVCKTLKAKYGLATWRQTGDPAALQRKSVRTSHNENTDAQVLERIAREVLADGRYAIPFEVHRTQAVATKEARPLGHRMIRRLFKVRGDNRTGMVIVEKDCRLLVDGFEGGYRLEKRKGEAGPDVLKFERPNRTSDHVHVMDAFRHLVVQRTERGSLPIIERPRDGGSDFARIERLKQAQWERRVRAGIA